MPGDVTVRVDYSTAGYKDAMAVTVLVTGATGSSHAKSLQIPAEMSSDSMKYRA